MAEAGQGSNTIFDDVYRTMARKMPRFFVPLINVMFGKGYDAELVRQLRNEFFTVKGDERVTDSSRQRQRFDCAQKGLSHRTFWHTTRYPLNCAL